MAFRRPLKLNGSNLQEMSDTDISNIVTRAAQLYSASPSVRINYTSSGGNMGTFYDSRKTAGAHKTSTTGYPSESTTPEPGTVTVSYSRMNQVADNTSYPGISGGMPCYYDSNGDIREMTWTDFNDTFGGSVRDLIKSSITYNAHTLSTTSSLSGWNQVGHVFSDTRANTSAYTGSGIPETLDQPTTITNYYIHRRNSGSVSYTSINAPIVLDSSNLKQASTGTFDSFLQGWAKHYISEVSPLRYNINGSGTSIGTMYDTILNGSGNHQTRFVNANDYRAQEFPNGSAVTNRTYTIRSN